MSCRLESFVPRCASSCVQYQCMLVTWFCSIMLATCPSVGRQKMIVLLISEDAAAYQLTTHSLGACLPFVPSCRQQVNRFLSNTGQIKSELVRCLLAEFMGTLLFQIFGGAAPPKDTTAPAANGFALVCISELQMSGCLLHKHRCNVCRRKTLLALPPSAAGSNSTRPGSTAAACYLFLQPESWSCCMTKPCLLP